MVAFATAVPFRNELSRRDRRYLSLSQPALPRLTASSMHSVSSHVRRFTIQRSIWTPNSL